MQNQLRVVPLFETLDDLENAPATIQTLFSSEWYINHIGGLQECMIGAVGILESWWLPGHAWAMVAVPCVVAERVVGQWTVQDVWWEAGCAAQ